MDLTTLASAKLWLSLTGTTDDPLLTRLISGVSAAAQARMGRQIAVTSYTDVRNGNGKTVLAFPNQPAIAVTSLLVDGVAIPARTDPTGSGYIVSEQLLYVAGYTFTRGIRNVSIAYSAGYSSTPADLEQAVIEIVAHKYRERDHIGQASKIIGTETVTYLRDVPVDALRVIDSYRRILES